MSFVHHEPDISRVPCLACDELIEPHELFKHSYHFSRSCCSWHAYHYWCIRPATTALAPMDICADCCEPLEDDEIDAAVRWGESFHDRVHKGYPYSPEMPNRPEAIRLVAWWRRPRVDVAEFSPREGVPETKCGIVLRMFEIVHDECPALDDWRVKLREAPDDNDLREVYADHLEGSGDTRRAEFVRLVLRRRRATGERATFLDRQLRELRDELPGPWVRDVARHG